MTEVLTKNQRKYQARRDEILAKQKAQRKENPEHRREIERQYRERNCGRIQKIKRDWHHRTNDKRFFKRRIPNLRGGDVTAKELAALWKRQRGRCALTGRRLDRTAELDHILPKSKGGTNTIGNLRWTCRIANQIRCNWLDEDFIAMCRDVAAHHA